MKKTYHPCLSEDLILYGILPHVPIKPLFTFKLVCKKWCTTLSHDPLFKIYQSRKCLSSTSNEFVSQYIYGIPLTFLSCAVGVTNRSLNYMTCQSQAKLISSSNGLIVGRCLENNKTKVIFICNPLTEDWICMPLPKPKNPNQNPLLLLPSIGFAFDPLDPSPYYTIVWPTYEITQTSDPACSRYYVCRKDCLHASVSYVKIFGFKVYSSKTGQWTESNVKLRVCAQAYFKGNAIFICGKLFWMMPSGSLLQYNVKEDTANFTSSLSRQEIGSQIELGECNGKLSFIETTSGHVKVWIMIELESQFTWVIKYCISWETILADSSMGDMLDTSKTKPLPFQGEELLFWMKVVKEKRKGKIFSYNLITQKLRILCTSSYPMTWFVYKNTLAPLPKLCS